MSFGLDTARREQSRPGRPRVKNRDQTSGSQRHSAVAASFKPQNESLCLGVLELKMAAIQNVSESKSGRSIA